MYDQYQVIQLLTDISEKNGTLITAVQTLQVSVTLLTLCVFGILTYYIIKGWCKRK